MTATGASEAAVEGDEPVGGTGTSGQPATGISAPESALRLRRVVRSEWVKFRSLRSSWVVLAVTVAITVGLGAAFCGFTAAHWSDESFIDKLSFDPTQTSLGGVFLAQLSIGVLGVLFVTGEYATGQVRSTFAAVPKRLPVLVAKLLVFTVVAVVVALPSVFLGFELGQLLLAGQDIQTTLGAPGVLRAVIGAALYLAVIGLFGGALGWLVRHTAGAIATLVGLLLILPLLVEFLPADWTHAVAKWLPSDAGASVFTVVRAPYTLSPWAGFGVLCAWVAAFLVAATVQLARRDV